MKKLDLNQELN